MPKNDLEMPTFLLTGNKSTIFYYPYPKSEFLCQSYRANMVAGVIVMVIFICDKIEPN